MRHGKEIIMSINLGTPIKTKLNPKLYAITPEIAAQLLRNTDANPPAQPRLPVFTSMRRTC